MSLVDDLIAAKALIDSPEKWTKGFYQSMDGCLCSLGALGMAIGGNPFFPNSVARAALQAEVPQQWGVLSVGAYNDDPDTTHADIMALFDRAIARAAREKGGDQ